YAEKRMVKLASKISADKAFRKMSRIEQKRYLQHMEWEIQRRYFDKVERAAASRVKSLSAAGKNTRKAEQLHEAAKVKPIAGRLPVNHKYAGKAVPANKLPQKYRAKGLRFTEDGFPDFGPHAVKLPNGKTKVKIKFTGRNKADDALANKAAGFNPPTTPEGFTWHHHQDGTSMQLVSMDLHTSVRHTGGTAHYRHVTGDKSVYLKKRK
ncbi:MAG: HNH endonuclease, partial [Nitrospira sp.]|nr:HNH endonuclease [Nitrospira sp.]